MRNWTCVIRAALFGAIGLVLIGNGIACNTVKGAGKDVERAGEKVQDVADDAQH